MPPGSTRRVVKKANKQTNNFGRDTGSDSDNDPNWFFMTLKIGQI
jgi:hypothetical protein